MACHAEAQTIPLDKKESALALSVSGPRGPHEPYIGDKKEKFGPGQCTYS